jgi:chitinase
MDWNTNIISTNVTGTHEALLSAMPSNLKTVTWAFATGECGEESWAGIAPSAVANANVQGFAAAGKQYIISTGGAAGTFTCTTDAGFDKFVNTYLSRGMIGVDFDIEGGQSQSDIDDLVQRVVAAEKVYPNLRFSFTLATLGGSAQPSLGALGVDVMNSMAKFGLKSYSINLMVMDYGSASASNCVISGNGQCEMGLSAVQAATDLHGGFQVPYSQMELTPMIGGNDTQGETFTLADAMTVTNFVKQNGLAGVHFWSLDRDTDCAPGYASPTCNTYGQAGALGFTAKFLAGLAP